MNVFELAPLIVAVGSVPGPAGATDIAALNAGAVPTDLRTHDEGVEREVDAPAGPAPVGVSVDVGVLSAYVFRGLNLLKSDTQQDQRAVLQPYLAYDIVDGLSVSYFASFQLTGDNRDALVRAGTGHEQDLAVTYTRDVTDWLSIASALNAYLYPFANRNAAGTRVPVYLEPMVTVGASTVVDLTLSASFMGGLQSAISAGSYFYLNPRIGKTFELSGAASLTGAMGYGVKAQRTDDNRHDVLVELSLKLVPHEIVYVAPSLHWAWTNLEGEGFAGEQVAWGATNVGASF